MKPAGQGKSSGHQLCSGHRLCSRIGAFLDQEHWSSASQRAQCAGVAGPALVDMASQTSLAFIFKHYEPCLGLSGFTIAPARRIRRKQRKSDGTAMVRQDFIPSDQIVIEVMRPHVAFINAA